MSVISKTYWEVCIEINPLVSDIVCDIIQTEFDCEGIITAEEKYKNLELIESTENILKAYIVSDFVDINELRKFFNEKKNELESKHVFDCDLGSWNVVSVIKQDNTDWSKKWKENWKPSKISGRIVISPTWENYKPKDDEIVVNIDPGNAFGTGTHATTQLCVNACEKYMKKNAVAADIGTGSGILAICAMKLGAISVDAVDNDDTAVQTAIINAEVNKEKNIVFKTAESDVLPSSMYDFVFANILHNVLAEIMHDLKRIMKPHAKMVLSGILEDKADVVLSAVDKNNLKLIEIMHQKEWVALVVEKES